MKQEYHGALAARGLTLWRGDRLLFEALSFAVDDGQILHLQGANGTGKTSLLRVLCGFSEVEAGSVFWRGTSLRKDPYAFNRELAYVGHRDSVKAAFTPLENLRFSLGLRRGVSDNEIEAGFRRAGIAAQSGLPTGALSAGQRRRVALVRAQLSGATLWILDEPFANLDVDSREWCQRAIEAHAGQGGIVILTSHLEQPLNHDAVNQLVLGAS